MARAQQLLSPCTRYLVWLPSGDRADLGHADIATALVIALPAAVNLSAQAYGPGSTVTFAMHPLSGVAPEWGPRRSRPRRHSDRPCHRPTRCRESLRPGLWPGLNSYFRHAPAIWCGSRVGTAT